MAATSSNSTGRILRVGIIGCGEVSQVIHIPNLNNLSDWYQTTYLCDVSQQTLAYCATKVLKSTHPRTTTDAEELCASSEVDVVLIANADAYHVPHALLALKHNKYCLLEKPAALCFRDIDLLIAAEKESQGKVLVGTMRRYASALEDAIKEIGGMAQIKYARVRDIIGPNALGVAQSGMFPRKFEDFSEQDTQDRLTRDTDMHEQALREEFRVPVTEASRRMLRILGALGTHDLSAMRELLGMPESVAGAVLTLPGIFSVLFKYNDFPVTYESGLINVPEFDAHIEVYSAEKVVRIQYDTPYVKGLPVTMMIRERVGDGFQVRNIRKTFEDPYTLELLAFHDCAVNKKVPKTSVEDARNDIELFRMILQAGSSRYQS
ncbi:NAD(P)-binding protein [Lophiostoma macrostomum CBS 122681]|uniref:NAD(P)-binding protein n=1 Tax=Lophiostoma macrostomum CBS 122681 TaxID=1314788 RepID=A0A6A6TF35_9PLEO|nr:NAD(P)-binding protein [Lophiostoma macrostomum CBS 122681]